MTSCVHNILSGQRWIEHYGEISIRNTNGDVCQCKITFVKVRKYTILLIYKLKTYYTSCFFAVTQPPVFVVIDAFIERKRLIALAVLM